MSISAAVDGRGVCLESLLLVQRELDAGTLIMPFGLDGPRIACHSLVYLASRAQLPKVVAFRDWLYESLSVT
jgi:LysR family transcriptional regulator, glycine cleavage system transcriptional activator